MNAISLESINLGIICPMANERSTASTFINQLLVQCVKYKFRSIKIFVIFDDKCNDGTFTLLKKIFVLVNEVEIVYAPDNKCVVDAYKKGYTKALNSSCDWILEIDAGFSHQPSDIPIFFLKMLQGYDCVFGSRFCYGGRYTDSSLKRYLLSRCGAILVNMLLGTKLTDMTSGFELFSRDALIIILDKGIESRGSFFQTEIKYHAHRLNIAEVPIHYRNASDKNIQPDIIEAFQGLSKLFFQDFI